MFRRVLCFKTVASCCYSNVTSRLPKPALSGVNHESFFGASRNPVNTEWLSNASKLCVSPHTVSVGILPVPLQHREIIEPILPFRGPKEQPPLSRGEIILPQLNEKELLDPCENVIEKRAARLIVIRRAKMKKHKWRKLQKKMKFVFARRRQRKELRKEKAFQAVLVAQVKEAEKFEAEAFITRQLQIAHWERPVTHVRNRRAPDWVIRDHLRELEETRRINDRIEQCLRFKNK